MLAIKAEIMFFRPNGNSAINDGISTNNILRPAFNFGEGLLFSGTIESDSCCEKYIYENLYVVTIKFPTIEDEAYEVVKSFIKKGMNLDIQNASKIIGKSILLDYEYKEN
ncbi:hypothetical protein [Desulfosporosinus nitroreducens]|uniref:hypothetical protein n=1 Tax=Desulfosporosinus nitroreducens TaxID=2018668 RepID=UPI00207C8A93|nr:hypothetical protein [Desulfosporosinus nitroreducens]MCO1604055.1 hypothetical protein [Desulfosporosinus nitroreducens]MDA8221006.1 hypothetical protein [Desulfitobacterium hafniense]